jgi:FKBP-type peptidyl-prolyl cis-trans isomerase
VFLNSCSSDDQPGLEQYYDNRDEGISFLEANKLREDVEILVTDSGLQYEVINTGEGETTVKFDDVKLNFTVQKIDGSIVSSNMDLSIDEIAYSKVNLYIEQFIVEGLQLMNVGSTYKFYVPYQLAYGQYSNEDILPFSALIVEIHLLENFFIENALKDSVRVTESGLQYEIITLGIGDNTTLDDKVKVHYHGTFLNGDVFDSSVDRGTPSEFYVNQVIEGWIEGLQLMNTGAKFKFYIPYNLAYGARNSGSIPAYSPLVFEVELLEINPIEITD